MKLLSVHLKNLNSLKGEICLSFDKAPLKNCSLFLITGATGAGKSTILDAITLALFGEVPRFQGMGDNKKEQKIVTYGAEDAFSEVTFERGGQVYRAKWSIGQISRGKNKGKFNASKRELVQLAPNLQSGEILATKKAVVNQQIEALLGGLNFKRFTRSVLLAQGDFAEFLKNVKDRAEILERITNTERYSTISTAAYERHDIAKKALENLEEQKAHFSLLSSEEKTLLLEEQTSLEDTQKEDETQIKTLQQQLQQLQELSKLKTLAQQLDEAQQRLATEQEHAQPSLNALKQHHHAAVFQPELLELEKLQSQQTACSTALQSLLVEVKQQKEVLATTQMEKEKVQQQQQEANKEYEVFDKNYTLVVTLDNTIANEQQYIQKVEDETQALSEKIKRQIISIEALEKKKNTASATLLSTQKWLSQHTHYAPLLTDSIIETLQLKRENWTAVQEALAKSKKEIGDTQISLQQTQQKAQELQQQSEKAQQAQTTATQQYNDLCNQEKLDMQCSHLERLQYLQQTYQGLNLSLDLLKSVEEERKVHQQYLNELMEQEEEIKGQEGALEQWDSAFLNNEIQLEQARKDKMYYAEVYQNRQEQNSLSELRGALEEGKKCPLCFATEHPFRKEKVDISFALKKAAIDLKKAEELYEACYQKDRDIVNSERLASRLLQQAQKKKEQIQEKIEAVEGRISALLEQLPTPNLMVRQQQALQQQIRTTDNNIQHYKQVEEQLKECKTLEDSQGAEVESLGKQLLLLQEQQKQQEQHLQKLTEDIQEEEQKVEQLATDMQQVLQNFGLKITDKQALQKLNTYKKEYQQHQEQKQLTTMTLEQLEQEEKHAQERLSDWNKEQTVQQNNLEKQKEALQASKDKRYALFAGDSVEKAKQNHLKQLKELQTTLEGISTTIQQQEQTQATCTGKIKVNQEQLQQLGVQVKNKTTHLNRRIEEEQLGNVETLKQHLLEAALVEEYEQLGSQLQTRKERLEQQQEDNQKALEKQQMLLAEVPASVEDIRKHLALLEDKQKGQLQRLGVIKEKLEQQALQYEKHKKLLEEIEQHQKEVSRWGALNNLIGSKNGKTFSQFAQSITLKKLVQLANIHLGTFLDQRYYLETRVENTEQVNDGKNNQKLLEIDIVDTFQLHNKRPLNTLSGGESFLASLSLALGLSDLAAGKTTIESLFVDEGFGTLDNNTLQMAVRALQSLEAQGKMVGIISHVEKLKQSIDTQIQVTKKGGGYSKVTVK